MGVVEPDCHQEFHDGCHGAELGREVPSEETDDVEEGDQEECDQPVDRPFLGLLGGTAAQLHCSEGVVEGDSVDDQGGEGTSQH